MTPQQYRAAGKHATADLLERLEATKPFLLPFAHRLLDAPIAAPADRVAALGEIRDAVGALRLLAARRELADLEAVLRDDPAHPDAAARRGRVLAISRYLRDAERSGRVRPRPWPEILAQETKR
jgi:hypothetical protein